MKNYTITVNGNVYEVSVEENTGAAPVQAAAPAAVKKAPAAPKKAASAGAGTVKITAPMPGKILDIKSKVGDSVKKGQVIMILEAMKMENEIVAAQDGTVASIDVTVGAAVEAGVVLASLN